MDVRDAEIELRDYDLLVFAKGALPYVKQMRDRCLEADIPAMVGRCDSKG